MKIRYGFQKKIACTFFMVMVLVLISGTYSKAQSVTAEEVKELEKDVASMEIHVPLTEVGVGWRYTPELLFYPTAATGLDTSEPISYFNKNGKDEEEYEQAVKWSTSDESIMTVEKIGSGACIHACKEGTVTITATLGELQQSITFQISGEFPIVIGKVVAHLYEDDEHATGEKSMTIKAGEPFDLLADVYIEGTPNYDGSPSYMIESCDTLQYGDLFTWSSSDESVVAVKDSNAGNFKAMKKGKAVLTVSVGEYTDSIEVTVKENSSVLWVSPVIERQKVKKDAREKGVTIHSKKQLYQYVYDCLSTGNYEIYAIYPEEYLDFDLGEELDAAIELYAEYVIPVDKVISVNYDTGVIVWGSGGLYTPVGFQDGREAEARILYNPDSEKMVRKMTTKADSIIKSIIKKGMTTKNKLKAIHDYLIKNCSYDMEVFSELTIAGKTYTNKNTITELSYSAYGALINKKAVCEGYAYAFNLLARRAGIPSIFVTGRTSNALHAWNMVKVGSSYRYIDVTWDDPIDMSKADKKHPFNPIISKKIYTKYFCITAKQLKKDHTLLGGGGEGAETYYKNFYKKNAQYTILK